MKTITTKSILIYFILIGILMSCNENKVKKFESWKNLNNKNEISLEDMSFLEENFGELIDTFDRKIKVNKIVETNREKPIWTETITYDYDTLLTYKFILDKNIPYDDIEEFVYGEEFIKGKNFKVNRFYNLETINNVPNMDGGYSSFEINDEAKKEIRNFFIGMWTGGVDDYLEIMNDGTYKWDYYSKNEITPGYGKSHLKYNEEGMWRLTYEGYIELFNEKYTTIENGKLVNDFTKILILNIWDENTVLKNKLNWDFKYQKK